MTHVARAAAGICALYALVLAAPFVAPYDPATQYRDRALAPPTAIHFVGADGRVHLRPFVVETVDGNGDGSGSAPTRIYPIRFFVPAPADEGGGRRLFAVDSPAHLFLLGTDGLGRDQFSRLLHGGRVSLGAGVLAAALALGAGLLLGGIAGYSGGWVDMAIGAASEVFLALPWLYLLLAIRAALPLDLTPARALAATIVVIGTAGWARSARLVRGVVLSVRTRDFVAAATASGASPARVLRAHVIPEVLGVAITQASILIPQYTLAEITLSFFGLGVGEPTPSWGTMIASMLRQQLTTAHWWLAAPAAALVAVSLVYHGAADAVQERGRDLAIGVPR